MITDIEIKDQMILIYFWYVHLHERLPTNMFGNPMLGGNDRVKLYIDEMINFHEDTMKKLDINKEDYRWIDYKHIILGASQKSENVLQFIEWAGSEIRELISDLDGSNPDLINDLQYLLTHNEKLVRVTRDYI